MRKLIGWPLLNEIFLNGHGDCWLAREGKLHPKQSSGRLDLAKATAGFDEGYTVVVRHSERAHPALERIAGEFQTFYEKPVDIQLYCTPEGQQGFDWHYDLEDVFVIQSSGVKEFRLRKNRRRNPVSFTELSKNVKLDEEVEGQEIRCTLKGGDLLYIPSGYWHCATAMTPSYHLSVGVLFR